MLPGMPMTSVKGDRGHAAAGALDNLLFQLSLEDVGDALVALQRQLPPPTGQAKANARMPPCKRWRASELAAGCRYRVRC